MKEIDVLIDNTKATESAAPENIDEAFEALMNESVEVEEKTETEDTSDVMASLESIMTELDAGAGAVANEADEAGDGGAANKTKFQKLKEVVTTFWKDKIVGGLKKIKESFSKKIASLAGKKFTLNVKKWGIWQRLVDVWHRVTSKKSTASKSEVVSAMNDTDPVENAGESFTAATEADEAEANGESEKLEKELDAPPTESDGKKDVDGNVISRVIGTILKKIGEFFSAFKGIPNALMSKIKKGESSKDESIFHKIAAAVKRALQAVGHFFSTTCSKAWGLLGKLPKVFSKKKAYNQDEDESARDTSAEDSYTINAEGFDSALEALC